MSEQTVNNELRLFAAQNGFALWRNNSGALKDESGRMIRFGLGNDSPRINDVWKTSDLIGILPMLIQPQHVGRTVGLFLAIESKRPGWYMTPGDRRAIAQAAFHDNVRQLGGVAGFATGAADLIRVVR